MAAMAAAEAADAPALADAAAVAAVAVAAAWMTAGKSFGPAVAQKAKVAAAMVITP